MRNKEPQQNSNIQGSTDDVHSRDGSWHTQRNSRTTHLLTEAWLAVLTLSTVDKSRGFIVEAVQTIGVLVDEGVVLGDELPPDLGGDDAGVVCGAGCRGGHDDCQGARVGVRVSKERVVRTGTMAARTMTNTSKQSRREKSALSSPKKRKTHKKNKKYVRKRYF